MGQIEANPSMGGTYFILPTTWFTFPSWISLVGKQSTTREITSRCFTWSWFHQIKHLHRTPTLNWQRWWIIRSPFDEIWHEPWKRWLDVVSLHTSLSSPTSPNMVSHDCFTLGNVVAIVWIGSSTKTCFQSVIIAISDLEANANQLRKELSFLFPNRRMINQKSHHHHGVEVIESGNIHAQRTRGASWVGIRYL
jgi:hypothetical protein